MNKHLVIIGGGFAGLTLARKLPGSTVISEHDYFLFTPNLYEVATAEEELVSQKDLKKSITLYLPEVLKRMRCNFIQGEVSSIDLQKQRIQLATRQVPYDQLVLAMGSESEYFGIPGAAEFSIPLKTVKDALKIRNALGFAVQSARQDTKKRLIRFVVAGGGYTGVELAAELAGLVKFLSWKNGYPLNLIEVLVVEAANELISGLDPNLSHDSAERLTSLGVWTMLNSRITEVEQNFIKFSNGERLAFDVLIWTAGVRGKAIPLTKTLETDHKGRVIVNEYFQVNEYHNLFALGDVACKTDKKGMPAPPTGQEAERQAHYLAWALPIIQKNHLPKPYDHFKQGYVVMVGGQWAILKYGPWYLRGRLAYFLKQIVHWLFFAPYLGHWQALKYTIFQIKIFSRND